MRPSFILGGVAAVMLLAGCNHAAPEASPSVPGAVIAAAGTVPSAPGTGSIRGRGLARAPAAELLTCAGFGVLAVPSREENWQVERTGAGQLVMEDQLARLAAAYGGKYTKCSPDGRFVISDLTPGRWLVVTPIIWRSGLSIGCEVMSEAAVVAAGKTTDIVITYIFSELDSLTHCDR
jgi:hypothetical protein